MSASNLPPLQNLPSWSRAGTFDRARYHLLFSSECEQKAALSDRHGNKTTQTSTGMDTAEARVASLEKDILFLQQTHKTTLEKLHEEIEHLKRANKELQYQLIMGAQHRPPTEPSPGGLHEIQCQAGVISSEEKPDGRHHCVEHNVAINMSLFPLRIQDGSSRPPHTPNLQECEAMIRQLYNTNTLQSQELLQVKAVLRDVLKKKKLSLEVCNLTKTYLSNNTRSGKLTQIPELTLKPFSKIQHSSLHMTSTNQRSSHQPQVSVREKVMLPAIRQTKSSNLTERQKRAQDMHKMRFRRAIFS